MKRLTLFLVSAILLLAAVPASAKTPTTVIITRTKQVWAWAQYWDCYITFDGKPAKCKFKRNRYVWIPQAAHCGLRSLGNVDGSPYNVTVCWLHGRRIVGPAPLPDGVILAS